MGLLFLTKPGAVIHENEIELKNVWGMTLRRVPFPSRGALTVVDGKLMVEREAGPEKVFGGFGVDGGDLERVREWIAAG